MSAHAISFTKTPIKIAYERVGQGPIIVFLHGIGGNRSNWAEQLSFFRKRFCAVAWDARGYGDSGDSNAALKFSDFADDLCELLDDINAEKAHLVGLSMGGMIVQDFYHRYSNRVASLTLAATSDGFCSVTPEETQKFLALRLSPLEQGGTIRDVADILIEVLAGPEATKQHKQQLYESLLALRPSSYEQALRAIVTTNFRDGLSKIRVPTLVINGSADQVTPLSESETLRTHISDVETRIIKGAGHLINIEKPEIFNSILSDFITRHKNKATFI